VPTELRARAGIPPGDLFDLGGGQPVARGWLVELGDQDRLVSGRDARRDGEKQRGE
jgi:hypothetical protein